MTSKPSAPPPRTEPHDRPRRRGSLLVSLTPPHYTSGMKATLTSKGQITIPTAIRRRLGLHAGQVLEFDEEAPYILAVPVFDEEAMRAVIGCTRGRLRFSGFSEAEP